MPDKRTVNQIIIGAVGSLLAAVAIGVSQKLFTLTFWQMVSAYLGLLCATLLVSFICFYNAVRSLRNSNKNKLCLFEVSKPELAETITKCENSFKFLGISSKRTISNPIIQKKLISIGHQKGEIKILLLNPDGQFLSIRASDEGESPKAWISDIKATIERLKGLAQREHINIEIRLYDRYPVWRVTIIDNKNMHINFFLKGQQGPESQLLELNNKENDLFEAFQLEFEQLWEASIEA